MFALDAASGHQKMFEPNRGVLNWYLDELEKNVRANRVVVFGELLESDDQRRQVAAHPELANDPIASAGASIRFIGAVAGLGSIGSAVGGLEFSSPSKVAATPEPPSPPSAAREASVQRSMCFAAGTKVLMADGSRKAIEDIREGDEVLADDPTDATGPEAARSFKCTVRPRTDSSTYMSARSAERS